MTDSQPPPAFSVLLPVYRGDQADHLRRSFASATSEQTLPPDEVVLVQDGPVDRTLERTIEELCAASPVSVKHVVLAQNEGLARALGVGLAQCSHEVVARVDADDICEPERFAVQVPMVEGGLDLVGSAMSEFTVDPDRIEAVRRRPTTPEQIRRYAAFHNPFNHPTVVYRRSAVRAVGGYQEMAFMEDYWLFARMIVANASVANVEASLVRYRADDALYGRRGGLRLLRSDVTFQLRARSIGLTTPPQMVRNLAQRVVYRAVPDRVRKLAYRLLVARS